MKHKIPSALCIGDVMLDVFSQGHVSRISPEAPVPVLRLMADKKVPGGAANVARNFAALGGNVTLIGVIGDDSAGEDVTDALCATPAITVRLIRDASRRTIVKQRFTASGQQILRADTEDMHPLDQSIETQIIEAVETAIDHCDVILVSDYAKGLVTHAAMTAINTLAQARAIPVLVDPKRADWSVYGQCSLIKPNAKELAEASNLPTQSDTEIEAALDIVLTQYQTKAVLVTRAEKGMSTLWDGRFAHRAGQAKEVYDVSGAGDTVMAALGFSLGSGGSISDAMDLAIRASGIVVGKRGTAIVTREEIALHDSANVFTNTASLTPLLDLWRSQNLKIGFTNGCFDILHPGHLRIIEASKAKCDRLIIGLNSDASVHRLKGPSRPINSQNDRATMLAGLNAVDAVVVFEEDTPLNLIQTINPDLLAKGGDYTEETIVGADSVKAQGGEILIVPIVEGKSTTNIINRSA